MAGLLLGKQERTSAKGNRFAFLQLTDQTGMFEATIFSDRLSAAREHLEPGRPCCSPSTSGRKRTPCA